MIGSGGSGKSTLTRQLLREHAETKQIVWLRSRAEVKKFLRSL